MAEIHYFVVCQPPIHFKKKKKTCLLTVTYTKKMSDSKNTQHWSSEETSVLLAIWSSTEIQEKLESSARKKIVYDEISQEMLNGGFSRSTEQIMNKLKKLRKEYRDLKRKPSKGDCGHISKTFDHDLMESVLEHRPASQLTGALNPATAPPEKSADSVVFSVDERGKFSLLCLCTVLCCVILLCYCSSY